MNNEPRSANCCCFPNVTIPEPVTRWCRRYRKYFWPWPCPPPTTPVRTFCARCCPLRRSSLTSSGRIHPENNKVVVRRLNSSGSGGGVTNLSFQADDPAEEVNFDENGSAIGLEDVPITPESSNNARQRAREREWVYKRLASSLYLKTGPGKCIHVIHVQLEEKNAAESASEAPAPSVISNGHCAGEGDGDIGKADGEEEEDEEDEEYWFTKWSNRPKLKFTSSNNGLGAQAAPHRLSAPPVDPSTPQEPTFAQDEGVVSPDQVQITISSTDAEVLGLGITNPCFLQEQDEKNQNGARDGGDGVSHCSNTLSIESNTPSDRAFPVPDEIINLKTTPKQQRNIYKRRPDPGEAFENNGAAPPATFPTSEATPKAPLIFFVHGISGSSDVWAAQLDHFHARSYELVAIDLLGHGLSSAPPKAKFYTFESLLQDLVYVFDYFVPTLSSGLDDDAQDRPTRPVVLVGHGYGCCLTRVLCRLRPNSITALVSVAGGGPTPLAPPGTLRPPSLIPFQIRNIFAKKRSSGRFDPVSLRHVLPPQVRQHIIDGQIWVECDSAFHHRIQIPTLLVYGLRDTTVALVEECEMEKAMPKAFLELLPTAGHFPMHDEPRKLNRMMDKFLQAWLPPQTKK